MGNHNVLRQECGLFRALLCAAVVTAAWAQTSMFSPIDQDVLSALLNLGCGRPQAEAAVRKAKAGGAPADFETLFRRALELVR